MLGKLAVRSTEPEGHSIRVLNKRSVRVRTHWTNKICLALPKISTKFVSAKFLICQAWAH